MSRKRVVAAMVACIFILSSLGGVAFATGAGDQGPKGRPAGYNWGQIVAGKAESVTGEVYHPSLWGLERALANLEANGAGERAQEVLEELIAIRKDLAEFPGNIKRYERFNALRAELGDRSLRAFVNGDELKSDVPPAIVRNRTLLPLRALGESIGASFQWDPKTKTVTFELGGQVVTLVANSRVAVVNGSAVELDVPALVSNGRVLVPVRFVSEAMNCEVRFLANPALVIILPNADADDEDEVEEEEGEEEEEEEE